MEEQSDLSYGHADPTERDYIRALLQRVDVVTSPVSDVLELAVLLHEPCHRTGESIDLLRMILQREKNCEEAKIWLAECIRFGPSTQADVAEVRTIVNEMVACQGSFIGAAYQTLAGLIGDDNAFRDTDSRVDVTKMLEASVQHEPNWTLNRDCLSWCYRRECRWEEARTQLTLAIRNVISREPQMTLYRVAFESCITGRLTDRDRLVEELRQVQLNLGETA